MDGPTWIGRTLGGRYKIEALLGQGGMSAVYKATDPNLKRVVAVKLIHSHLSSDPSFVQRFESEASAVASLRHSNIVQVYDFNNDGGTYYMVLEFIPGETLQDRLKRLADSNRKLSLDEALQFSRNISDAVGYAHQRGLVHRDIKPANIMLDTQGQAILMDFGIVKILGGGSHTSTGAVVGTARYMSPEAIRGEGVDHRSDIYSLGVALYEMLSGRPPFIADSAMTLMMMHLHDPIPDVRGFRSDIPEEIVKILEKCLAKDLDKRYQSSKELSKDLDRAIEFLKKQTESMGSKETSVELGTPVTIMEERPLLTPVEVVPDVKTRLEPKQVKKPETGKRAGPLRLYLVGGVVLMLLLCAAGGTALYRGISGRNAQGEETPFSTEAISPSTDEPADTQEAIAHTPTVESVVGIAHLLIPSDVVDNGVVIFDVESVDTASENRAPYGDSYDINLLERPFLQDMTYVPDLDISTFNIRQTEDWYYVSMDIVGTDPNNPLEILYGVELDIDRDGYGDFLILASSPFSTDWKTEGVRVFEDSNHDTAGESEKRSDAPYSSDGYETMIFDGVQGLGDDVDLAWARFTGEHTIQIAFKRSWVGESFMYNVLSDAGLKDAMQMDYTDKFTAAEAGSSVRSNENYPLKALYAVDTTCRNAFGFSPTGYEPRICALIVLPTQTGAEPTGCQPPGGSCDPGLYWWPDPHCACSVNTPPP